jgi:hypothetical protein
VLEGAEENVRPAISAHVHRLQLLNHTDLSDELALQLEWSQRNWPFFDDAHIERRRSCF